MHLYFKNKVNPYGAISDKFDLWLNHTTYPVSLFYVKQNSKSAYVYALSAKLFKRLAHYSDRSGQENILPLNHTVRVRLTLILKTGSACLREKATVWMDGKRIQQGAGREKS